MGPAAVSWVGLIVGHSLPRAEAGLVAALVKDSLLHPVSQVYLECKGEAIAPSRSRKPCGSLEVALEVWQEVGLTYRRPLCPGGLIAGSLRPITMPYRGSPTLFGPHLTEAAVTHHLTTGAHLRRVSSGSSVAVRTESVVT